MKFIVAGMIEGMGKFLWNIVLIDRLLEIR